MLLLSLSKGGTIKVYDIQMEIGLKANLKEKVLLGLQYHIIKIWRFGSKKQNNLCVSLSSAESEYYAAATELLYLKHISEDLGKTYDEAPLGLFMDSQSNMNLIKNQEYSKRGKQIYIRAHYIKDHVEII